MNSYQKSILKSSFKEKRKQDSIMRFLTKDPIWHLDLKTKLGFFSKIQSFKWKSKQDFILRYATKASIGHLDLKWQDLSGKQLWMKLQTKFHCEICDKRFNLTSNFKRTRLEFISVLKYIQIKDPYKSTRNPYYTSSFPYNPYK